MLLVALCAKGQTTPAEGQVWWGYWNSTLGLSPAITLSAGSTNCSIRLTAANNPLLRGLKAYGLRFAITDKTAINSARLWMGRRTNTDVLEQDIDLGLLRDEQHDGTTFSEVLFSEPVDLLPAANPYANLYVGLTLGVTAEKSCQLMTSVEPDGTPYSCLLGGQDRHGTYGSFAIQLLVAGETLPALAVQPQQVSMDYQFVGQTVDLNVPFVMTGSTPVSSMEFDVTVGAKTEHFATNLSYAYDQLETWFVVPVSFVLPAEARHYDYTVSMTSINGQPVSGMSAASPFYVLSQLGYRRSVMEEFTGTWCPNCPRGDVGIHLLEEQFGDRFIGISVHNGDPMTVADYDQSQFKRTKMAVLGGYPSCTIDRYIDCDPYQGLDLSLKRFQTDQLVEYALAQPTVADLQLSAAWTDATLSKIDCQAATTFHFGSDEAPYSLIFILTADSLVGEGDSWLQVNAFAGSTDWDEPMAEFTQGPKHMEMAYDHVAVAIDGVNSGVPGSIVAPLVSDEPQHRLHRFDVGGNTIIQDRSRLKAVALLIDTRTGDVVNAASAPVLSSDAAAISPDAIISQQHQQAGRWFGLDGRPVSAPQRPGLYLRQQSDGSFRKMLNH